MLGNFPSKASYFRRKAAAVGVFVAHARSPTDREHLLSLQRAWLASACNADWYDGPPPRPPAKADALTVRPRS
jgi:hypothetical protein